MSIQTEQTRSENSRKRRRAWRWIIVMVLPFTSVFPLWGINGWTWVTNNWDKVLVVTFGLEGIVTFIVADLATMGTDQRLDEIRDREKNIVNTLEAIQVTEKLLAGDVVNLEDATRRNLSGFAEIFDRSLWLLERAEEELVYANFALGFGNPHGVNRVVADSFEHLEHKKTDSQEFDTAVTAFWTTLQRKASSITKLKIVTLTDDAYTSSFIEQLSSRPGYDELKKDEVKKAICAKEVTRRTALMDTLNAREGQREGSARRKLKMTEEWRVGKSLPVQILIAGLSGEKNTARESRRGCVVFLLGTESVAGVKKLGAEAGFYTELPHIVKMYEDLIDNVAEGFDVVDPKTARVAH